MDFDFSYNKPIALPEFESPLTKATAQEEKPQQFDFSYKKGTNENLLSFVNNFGPTIERVAKESNDPEIQEKILVSSFIADRLGSTIPDVLNDYDGSIKRVFGSTMPTTTALAAIKDAFAYGTLDMKQNVAMFRYVMGGQSPSDERYIAQLESSKPPLDSVKRPWWGEIGKSAAQMGATMWENWKFSVPVGLAGAAAATPAAIAASAPNAGGALAILASGFFRGMSYGSSAYTGVSEAGGLMRSLLDQYDKAGVSRDESLPVIKAVSLPVGLVNAIIEKATFKYTPGISALIKKAEGQINKEIRTAVVSGGFTKLANDAIKKQSLKYAGLTAVKGALEEVVVNIGQELLQEATTLTGEAIAKGWTNAFGSAEIDQKTSQEVLSDLLDTLKTTAESMLVFGPLGGATTFGTTMLSMPAEIKAAVDAEAKKLGIDQEIEKILATEPKQAEENQKQPQNLSTIPEPERAARFIEKASEQLPEGLRYQVTDEAAGQSILKVGDSKGERLNYVRFEPIVSEEEDQKDKIRIVNLETTESPAIAKALLNELASRYPGWDIEWDPQLSSEKALKEYIETQNPRGQTAGIQYFENPHEVPEYRGMEYLKSRIASRRPDFSTPEALDTISFVASRWAAKLGISPDEFVDKVLAPDIFGEIPEMRAAQAAGASKKVSFENSVKTLIDLAPRANPSSMTHELTHAVVNFALDHRDVEQIASFLGEIEGVLGIKDGNWQAEFSGWTGEYQKGNRSYMEALAYALEDYVTTGNAPTEEAKPILKRLAEWIYELYRGLNKARVNLTPELKDYFDSWAKGESPIITPVEQSVNQQQETAQENILFQDEKTLGVFHNIQADQILKIDNFGGLPAPSIAVTKPNIGFTQFGDATLIADPSVAREAMNEGRLFDRDIWSPTVPKPEWRINNNILYKLSAKMKDAGKELDRWASIDSFNTSDITSGAERLIRVLERSTEIQFAFLKEIGKAPEVQYKNKTMPSSESVILAVQKYLRSLKDNENVDVNEVVGIIKTTMRNDPEYADFEDAYIERHASGNRLNNIIDFAYSYEPGSTEVDYYATRDEIEKVIEGKKEQFKKWLTDQVEPAYSDPRITVQRKKIPFNAKTVMEWMRTQNIRGSQENITFGPRKAAAFAGEALESREEIAKKESSLVSQEESTQNWKENIEPLIDEINDELPKYYKYNDTWEALDSIYKAIANYFKGGTKLPSTARMRQSLSRELFTKVPNELIDKAVELAHAMINAPQDYFEAKPNRILTLNDFRAAVVPAKTDEKTKQAIKDKGLEVFEYQQESDRKQVVQTAMSQMENILFQDESPEFRAWFKGSKVVDENGTPLVVYKGMPKNDWRTGEEIESIDSPNGPWAGFFTDNERVADKFREAFSTMGEAVTHKAYIKIEKPFIVDAEGKRAHEVMFDDTVFGKNPTNPEALAAFSQGYDGVIIKNTEDEGNVYIPQSPTQIKSVNNRGTWDQNDPRILFQDDIESTAQEMAEQGQSWEELMEFYETPFMDDDRAAYGVDELSETEKRDWYKSIYEKALSPADDTPPDLTKWVLDIAQDDFSKMREYLNSVWENVVQVSERNNPEPGSDPEEIQAFLNNRDNAYSMRQQIAEPIIAGAIAIGNDKEVSKKFLASLHGIIKKNPEEYARIFGDITEDKKLASAGRLAEKEKYANIPDPELNQALSISQKAALAEELQDQELARAVLAGTATEEQITAYAKKTESELKAKEKQAKKLETDLKTAEIELDSQEKKIVELRQQEKDKSNELELIKARFQKYLEANKEIPEHLQSQRRKIEINRESIRKRMAEIGDWQEIERQLKSARDQERYYTAEIEKDRVEGKQLSAEYVRSRTKARDTIRTLEAKLTAAKGYKNSARLLTYTAQMEERTKIKDEVRSAEAKKRKAKELIAYRDSLIKQITRSPYIEEPADLKGKSRSIHYSYAQQIKDIQDGINKEYLSDKTQKVIDDIRERVSGNPDIMIGMDKTWLKRVIGKNLNEFTMAELEDMATTIRQLREQGAAYYDQVQEQERIKRESIIGLNSMELKSQPTYKPKEGFNSQKDPVQAFKQKMAKGLYEIAYDSHRFSQYILDGGERGENTKLISEKTRELRRQEFENKERRLSTFSNAVKRSGLTEADLQKRYTFENAGAENGKVVLTRDELIGMAMALKDQNSGRRAIFGTLFSIEEGERFKRDPDLMYDIADRRLAIILEGIETILDERDQVIMDAYSEDAKENGGRLGEAVAKTENRLMERVDNYFGIFIKGVTGKTFSEEIGEELKARIPGQRKGPDKSRTIARVEQSPSSIAGKPMELSITKVHTMGVAKTEHYITFADHAKLLNSVYKNSSLFRERLAQTHGEAAVEMLDKVVTEIINPELLTNMAKNDTLLRILRGNLSISYLSLRLSSVLKQLVTSPWPAFQEVGFNLFPAAMKFMVNPIGMTKKAEAHSAILRNRTIDMIFESMKHTIGDSEFSKLQKKVGEFGMKGLELVDRFSVAIGWQAMYEKVLKETGDEQKAVDEADRMIDLTQPSSEGVNNAQVYQGKSEFTKVVLQFTQQLNVVFRNIYIDAPQDIKGMTRKDLPKAVRVKHFEHLMGILISYSIAGGLLTAMTTRPKDDPDEERKRLLWGVTTQYTEALPFIGEEITNIMQYAITGEKAMQYGDSLVPGFSKLAQGAIKLMQGDIEAGIWRALEGGGMLLGVQTSAIKGLGRVLEGDLEGLIGRPKGD